MICKITNFLRIFFNRKKIRKIRILDLWLGPTAGYHFGWLKWPSRLFHILQTCFKCVFSYSYAADHCLDLFAIAKCLRSDSDHHELYRRVEGVWWWRGNDVAWRDVDHPRSDTSNIWPSHCLPRTAARCSFTTDALDVPKTSPIQLLHTHLLIASALLLL